MAGGSTPSRRWTSHSTADFGNRRRREARHVWVGTMPCPGVLIDWRKDGEAWSAFVVYVDSGRIIASWLPADLVRPAG